MFLSSGCSRSVTYRVVWEEEKFVSPPQKTPREGKLKEDSTAVGGSKRHGPRVNSIVQEPSI